MNATFDFKIRWINHFERGLNKVLLFVLLYFPKSLQIKDISKFSFLCFDFVVKCLCCLSRDLGLRVWRGCFWQLNLFKNEWIFALLRILSCWRLWNLIKTLLKLKLLLFKALSSKRAIDITLILWGKRIAD